jgi:hypothetical protein
MKGILLLEVFDIDAPKLPKPRHPVTPLKPHVTLQFNCESEEYKHILLRTAYISVSEEYYTERVQAVKVEIKDSELQDLCKNECPHISISRTVEAAFVESGQVYEGATKVPLEEKLLLKTVVTFQPFSLFKQQKPGDGTTDPS